MNQWHCIELLIEKNNLVLLLSYSRNQNNSMTNQLVKFRIVKGGMEEGESPSYFLHLGCHY